ncbi:MAG: XRE family transcriptional regulator, partial [Cytophagia bacterium]|nr:XRE family transcriptional regulator [Cytophagia bacterium]
MKKEELSKKIGKRIIQIREKKGMTQAELANVCMKDRQSIERIEKGNTNPTIYTLHEIANALGVSLSTLV